MRGMNHRISRAMLTAAVILFVLSVYEVCTRMDAAWIPLKMFVSMAIGEHIPLKRVLTYVDTRAFSAPLYMFGCSLLAVWALFARRSRRACAVLLIPCIAMTALGFTLRLTLFGELIKALKMLPLVALTVLCFLQVILRPRKCPEPATLSPARPGKHPKPAALPPARPARHRRSERHGRRNIQTPPSHQVITSGNTSYTADIPGQPSRQYETVPVDQQMRNKNAR